MLAHARPDDRVTMLTAVAALGAALALARQMTPVRLSFVPRVEAGALAVAPQTWRLAPDGA